MCFLKLPLLLKISLILLGPCLSIFWFKMEIPLEFSFL